MCLYAVFSFESDDALDAAGLEVLPLVQLDLALHGEAVEAVRCIELVVKALLHVCGDLAAQRVDDLLDDDDRLDGLGGGLADRNFDVDLVWLAVSGQIGLVVI